MYITFLQQFNLKHIYIYFIFFIFLLHVPGRLLPCPILSCIFFFFFSSLVSQSAILWKSDNLINILPVYTKVQISHKIQSLVGSWRFTSCAMLSSWASVSSAGRVTAPQPWFWNKENQDSSESQDFSGSEICLA